MKQFEGVEKAKDFIYEVKTVDGDIRRYETAFPARGALDGSGRLQFYEDGGVIEFNYANVIYVKLMTPFKKFKEEDCGRID